ncbi:CDC50/LEM3 family [Entophlyctis helioformis]|nr:CDC50/LEM3 family [Entophlyctis helioformis]
MQQQQQQQQQQQLVEQAPPAKRQSMFNPDNMRSWKLVFTPITVMTICGAFAIVLLPIGAILFSANSQLNEVSMDYTECATTAGPTFAAPASTVSGVSSVSQWKYDTASKTCTMRFKVPTTLRSKVFMYVRIGNMYQNHRLYVKSLDSDQLAGKVYPSAQDFPTSLQTSCAFLQYGNCDVAAGVSWAGNSLSHAASNPDCMANPRAIVIQNANSKAQYYPCGLIANSMFTDSISSLSCVGASCRIPTYTFSESGIAWPEDKSLYKVSGWASDPSLQSQIPTMLIPPPQWRQAWPELWGNGYNATNLPDLARWERFQVWMRKAGLPQFRKLWGRNDNESLDAGEWEVSVIDVWDCRRFDGTKALVFSEVGLMGPKNSFIGIAFLTVGGCSALFVFLVGFYRPRKLGDHAQLSWNKQKVE